MSDPKEFHENFLQDIIAEADAKGIYREDAFFDKFRDYLTDAGEFVEADRAYFQPQRSGMRVDGYCGDPLENKDSADLDEGTLGLIVLDFSQELELSTLTNTDMETAFKRLQKYLEKALDPNFRSTLEVTDPGFGLADLISTRWSNIGRVKLYLLTDKIISSRVDGKDAGKFQGRPVIYSVWDLSRLQKMIESGQEREALEVDFTELPNGPLRALLASDPKAEEQVYLAAVPGIDLATIYDRWGTRLLEQNVRVFLQARSNVNKGIRNTLENEPELFFSFNNGITATAENIETDGDSDDLHITKLENLQIVNGGQTTASIYAAYRNKKDLSKVFVQMKLSIVKPADAKELVPKISQCANSQNKVSAADFFANHPFHQRMEDFSRRIYAPAKDGSFNQTKWFYERARGQYRDEQAYLTLGEKKKFVAEYPRDQVFSKTDLAKYIMSWEGKPYLVNRGAQKNFAEFAKIIAAEWDKNEKQFSEYYYRCLIAKKIYFNATEKIVSGSEWYESGGYRAQHVPLTLGILANAADSLNKVIDFSKTWDRQAISPATEQALQLAADASHEVLMNPGEGYKNISEWAKQPKCWDNAKKVSIDWPDAWKKELISKENENENKRAGQKDQAELDDIEALTQVVEAGADFWKKVLRWCKRENEGSEKQVSILNIAASIPEKIPTDKQSIVLMDLMEHLESINCPYHLETQETSLRNRSK